MLLNLKKMNETNKMRFTFFIITACALLGFLAHSAWGQVIDPPDSAKTYPDSTTNVYEQPQYETVDHWLLPDTAYGDTIYDNNVGDCQFPWDAVTTRQVWIKGEDCQLLASGTDWCFVVFLVDGDSVWIPVPCGTAPDTFFVEGQDTAWIATVDTIVTIDSVWVMGDNGGYFAGHFEFYCDSVKNGYDTTLAESLYCKACDSFLVETHWVVSGTSDTMDVKVYQKIHPFLFDSCGIFSGAGITQIDYHYCIDCDTTVLITNHKVYNTYSSDLYVHYEENGNVYLKQHGDTIDIPDYSGGGGGSGGGIWVSECSFDTTADPWIPPAGVNDSIDAFLCIDTSWEVFSSIWTVNANNQRISTVTNFEPCGRIGSPSTPNDSLYTWATSTIKFADTRESRLFHVGLTGHGSRGSGDIGDLVVDSLLSRVNLTDSILTVDGNIPAKNAFFCGFDTTGSPGTFGTFVPYWDYGTPDCNDWNKVGPGSAAWAWVALRYEKVVNFSDQYTDTQIDILNAKQPAWIVFAGLSDDFTPWTEVAGQEFALDSTFDSVSGCGDYCPRIFRIQPVNLDYYNPILVRTGVYTCATPYFGAQLVFAIAMDESLSTRWVKKDSIILPACDTCADEFTWGPEIGLSNQTADSWYAVETCTGNDTLNVRVNNYAILAQAYAWATANNGMLAFMMMGADSLDSFAIAIEHDSVSIFDADSHKSPLLIHLATTFDDTLTAGDIESQSIYATVKASPLSLIADVLVDSTFRVKDTTWFEEEVFLGAGKKLWGVDATFADSFWFWDDGDTTQFDSDNPLEIGVNTKIDGDLLITGIVDITDNTTRIIDTASPYTILATDNVVFCDTDGGAIEVDLPAGTEGKHYKLINCGSGGNSLTVDPDGTEQVWGGGAGVALVLIDGEILDIHYNATEGWW